MRLWLLLHEPRVVTAAQSGVWMVWVVIGGVSFWSPPALAHAELSSGVTTAWGVLLLLGGSLGLVGCIPGWWWVERIGVGLASTGALVWLVALWASPPSADLGTRVLSAGFVVLAVGGLWVRWLRVQGPALDPLRRPHRGR